MKVPTVNLRSRKGKKGTTWYIDYSSPNGERVRKSLGNVTKAEAIEKKGEIQKELKEQALGFRVSKETIGLTDLFNKYLDYKRRSGLRASTLKRYENYRDALLEPLLKMNPRLDQDVSLASRSLLDLFAKQLEEQNSSVNTYNNLLTFLKAVFKYAKRENFIHKDPTEHLSKRTTEKRIEQLFYSKKELKAIWDHLLDHWVDVFQFYALTGIRKAELIYLPWKHVDLDQKKIKIAQYQLPNGKLWKPKNRHSTRFVPLSPAAMKIIERQKGEHPFYVFCSEKNKRLHPNTLENAFKSALKKSEIDWGGIHTLRHTFASQLAQQDVSLYRIAERLGHGSIETTKIYAHLRPSSAERDVNKIEI